MIILRQKNYTKPADEDNSEPKKNKTLKKAAIIGGVALGTAGIYQGSKHMQRSKAGGKHFKTTAKLVDTLRKASTKEDKANSWASNQLAKREVNRKAQMSGIEKLGHKAENILKRKTKK